MDWIDDIIAYGERRLREPLRPDEEARLADLKQQLDSTMQRLQPAPAVDGPLLPPPPATPDEQTTLEGIALINAVAAKAHQLEARMPHMATLDRLRAQQQLAELSRRLMDLTRVLDDAATGVTADDATDGE